MESHLDEVSKRIVWRWSQLTARGLEAGAPEIAGWLCMPVGDVEKRMRALARLEQLPGWSDE